MIINRISGYKIWAFSVSVVSGRRFSFHVDNRGTEFGVVTKKGLLPGAITITI